ncbi:ketose-bisphosphate aldolase class-ii family protein [Grosmannia clavigera kw1407]|uniref:Ketose-bisphosphate aldolase class-ii family protein n=1 Tax=Grosmannia clavigera (strain kw1407 / UAMH 11150) TaxID=655863 RepID=F0X9R6_GROCL|nr:ketose-bisphosphate aldolase class-ii family protein [Grosmannia clavigera kw1407]EFX05591.1 ketose-bisphosphate aldolase class-ii family protein [Grosmannia clavigera kw1407]
MALSTTDTSLAGVGFIGLGATGFRMAEQLIQGGRYGVWGFDADPSSMAQLSVRGGHAGTLPKQVAEHSRFLVCTVASEEQLGDVLFNNETGALLALPKSATILICSTIPPTFYDGLQSRLTLHGRPDVHVVDCPISGDAIIASGTAEALTDADGLLRSISANLHVITGGLGTASKVKLVHQLLVGTHVAAAAEAMALAAKAGLDTREVYDIIITAAGNSGAFEDRVPRMLDSNWTTVSALDTFVQDMGVVVSTGRSLGFPLPLGSTVEQLYIAASAAGYGREDDAGLVRMFLPQTPDAVHKSSSAPGGRRQLVPATSGCQIRKIGMIGLGAMGQGMAASLLRAGYAVHGFDIFPAAVDKFLAHGGQGTRADCPAAAARDANVVILMVQNALQAEDVLFGSGEVVKSLPDGAVVILSSTVPPHFVRGLQERLDGLNRGISLLDAPVSGGVARAASGNLTIICSGNESVVCQIYSLLMAMTGTEDNLRFVQGGVGAASSVKCVNQLLAGVHIAAAAEAMALASRLGLDMRSVYEIVSSSAACSWMFVNRVPQILDNDWTPHSALAIFVKDLGIVLEEGKRLGCICPVSGVAHNLYIAGAAHGLSREADIGLVRLWTPARDVSVAKGLPEEPEPKCIPLQETLKSLPAETMDDALGDIRTIVQNREVSTLVVLDDDPTGTQTCHDVNVLLVWDDQTLDDEFERNPTGFFILTNSRALPSAAARSLLFEICGQVKRAAERAAKTVDIVLRGDSTLRGHVLEEIQTVEEVMGPFDGWVISPFFFQGGRYTIDDIHYVAEGEMLVPASQTPFAQDATFGYKNSNLRKYILEKFPSQLNESSPFLSITIQDIRVGGPTAVMQKLLAVPPKTKPVIIVNAAAETDMHVLVSGLLAAAKTGGKRYLYRVGAAFVSSRLGIPPISPLGLSDLVGPVEPGHPPASATGGLIVCGSYVPKTTAQLKVLLEKRGHDLAVIELNVNTLVGDVEEAESAVVKAAEEATRTISQGKDVLVMTSRALITGTDALGIGSRVAASLVRVVDSIRVRPRYLIAKGGITSSDAASKSLLMRRARVLGQAVPGVPIWRCDEDTSRFPGIPYVVFPGNVGRDDTLAVLVADWAA